MPTAPAADLSQTSSREADDIVRCRIDWSLKDAFADPTLQEKLDATPTVEQRLGKHGNPLPLMIEGRHRVIRHRIDAATVVTIRTYHRGGNQFQLVRFRKDLPSGNARRSNYVGRLFYDP
ncbi:hypothetical protein [Aliiruegeria sabulilitoris]|uniref:hypothetical protein n=1 Tax=Aliiruegeria sabulilitoris TaxID=1510458 RepID=UPI0012E3835D|nr:hypothetical protein [Aliiruegeria sabulilitoris]NDR58235.1 hypothetical protein [Pseudoruegeria sp. M32A2M]